MDIDNRNPAERNGILCKKIWLYADGTVKSPETQERKAIKVFVNLFKEYIIERQDAGDTMKVERGRMIFCG